MRDLYIHCGLARTGTTAIQRYFSANRHNLRELEIEYLDFGVNLSRIAHHNIANEILNHRDFNSAWGTVDDVLGYLRSRERRPRVVLSSEGFVNCLFNKRTQDQFLGFVRSCIELNESVFLVFTVRQFSQFFDSWYIQRLKVGSAPLDTGEYLDECKRWLRRFFRSLRALKSAFGSEPIAVLDVSGDHSNSVSAFLSLLGIAERMPEVAGERPNERMGLKKAALVHQLQALANSGGHEEVKVFAPLRAAIVRAGDFPEEVFRYRIIPYDDANKLQTVARNRIPPFLKSAFSGALRREYSSYEAVSLATTRISVGDFEVFKRRLPPDLQSNRLFDHWLTKGPDDGDVAAFNKVKQHHDLSRL